MIYQVVTLYRGLKVASSDVSFGRAHGEEAGHDSFMMGTKVYGEVNVNNILVTGNIVAYGLRSTEQSGYVPAMAND